MQRAFPFFQQQENNNINKGGGGGGAGGGGDGGYSITSSLNKRTASAGCQNYTQLKQTNKTSCASFKWDGGYKLVKVILQHLAAVKYWSEKLISPFISEGNICQDRRKG